MGEEYTNKFNIIIPAAGQGQRLRPLTYDIPKCLVKVRGKSILERQLEAIDPKHVKKLILITGYRKHLLEEFVNNLQLEYPVKFYFNEIFLDTHCAYSFLKAAEEIREGFVLVNSDLLFKKNHFDNLISIPHNNAVCAIKRENTKTDLQKIKIDQTNRIRKWGLNLSLFDGEVMGPIKMLSKDASIFNKLL